MSSLKNYTCWCWVIVVDNYCCGKFCNASEKRICVKLLIFGVVNVYKVENNKENLQVKNRNSDKCENKNIIVIVLGILPSLIFGVIVAYYIIMSIVDPDKLGNVPSLLEAGQTSIVATAVSIWVGLNIYNFMTKNEIESIIQESNTKLEDFKRESDELQSDIYGYVYRNNLIEALSRHEGNYPINSFFIRCVDKINSQNSFCGLGYKELVRFEMELNKCTEAYEGDNWRGCFEIAIKLEDAFKILAKGYELEIEEKSYNGDNIGKESLEEHIRFVYLFERLGDVIFYQNAGADREGRKGDERGLEKAVQWYCQADNLLNNIKEINVTDEEKAYMKNTIGYTYFLLASEMRGRYQNNFKYYKSAIRYGEESIQLCDVRGRYFRNTALSYQIFYENFIQFNKNINDWKKECIDILNQTSFCQIEEKLSLDVTPAIIQESLFDVAKKGYERAAGLDKKDYKAYNNIGTVVLKKIDKKYGIEMRMEPDKLCEKLEMKGNSLFTGMLLFELFQVLRDSDDKKIEILSSIEEAKKNLKIAMEISPSFEDGRYNYAKACIYEGLLTEEEAELNDAFIELEKTFLLNKRCTGACHIIRNYYEAKNDIDNAYKENQKIYGDSDSEPLMQLYLEKKIEYSKDNWKVEEYKENIRKLIDTLYGDRLITVKKNELLDKMFEKHLNSRR